MVGSERTTGDSSAGEDDEVTMKMRMRMRRYHIPGRPKPLRPEFHGAAAPNQILQIFQFPMLRGKERRKSSAGDCSYTGNYAASEGIDASSVCVKAEQILVVSMGV